MFETFKGLGQMAELMRNLPRIREQFDQMQQRQAQITAEGDAGAGMVKVRVNGRMEVLSVTISDDAIDREMLEDLIKGAVNQAMARVRDQAAAEANKMAAGLGLPPGMNLPGMG
jgi:nucleoid-associated protein EbfC